MIPTLFLILCVVLRIVSPLLNFAPIGMTAVFAGRTLKLGTVMLLVAAVFEGDVAVVQPHGYSHTVAGLGVRGGPLILRWHDAR